jgi:transcriptional regulator with XRE-family HTH domain
MQATEMFRDRLRAAMVRTGVTQRELARRAETAQPFVNRVLQGRQTPSLDVADRLADAVGVTLAELLDQKIKSKKSA